jgi:hypothetical protein
MNGIGLMSLALIGVGVQTLLVAITGASIALGGFAMPFLVVGVLGLADDLLFEERITKKLLGLK